ncbi:MAG TPA: exo-alpha-sialidase [Firmicutes bacterium]|nr:exo-alpha-sialidase [Bacillota bacterium]
MTCVGDAAFCDKVDLFDNIRDGYVSIRIPAIAAGIKGTLLAFAVGRTKVSDWSASRILLRRSSDGGVTWTPAQVVAEVEGSVVDNPVPIVDQARRCVHLLYQTDYKRCYYTCTVDEGQSFAPPKDITATFEQFRSEYDWTVIAPGPGHGLCLSNGRLIVPIWMSDGGGKAHRPSVVSVIYSDDGGADWRRGSIAVYNTEATPNPSETVAYELPDGRVALNFRHESRDYRRGLTISADGIDGWSPAELIPDLYEPICCAGLLNLASIGSEHVLVFSNPAGDPDVVVTERLNQPRTNLTIRLSSDGGFTWPIARLLEPGQTGYSDLAATPDGTIYCLYECGTASDKMAHPAIIRIAKFNLAWVKQQSS